MTHPRSALRVLLAISATCCAPSCGPAAAPPPTNAAGPRASAARPGEPDAATAPRFDRLVSEDIFAGFRGDGSALARGLARCEEALAKNPIDPQPLVWHGMAVGFLGGKAYREGDPARGRILVDEGSRET